MNRIRIWGLAVMPLLLALTSVAALSAPAQAAGCSGYSCHGRDPVAQGCSASHTKEIVGSEAVINNRYSSNCNANWARAALTSQGYNDGDTFVTVITTTDSKGQVELMCYPGPSGTGALEEACSGPRSKSNGWVYTDMVDGTKETTASVFVYDYTGALCEVDRASL